MKLIVAKVERWLTWRTAVEQTIAVNLFCSERLGQDRNGRAFTGQLVPQESVA